MSLFLKLFSTTLIALLVIKTEPKVSALIITDACFTIQGCDVDPATHLLAPLNVMYRNQDTRHPDFLVDKPLLENWSMVNNITIVLHRPDPEALRDKIPAILSSSVGSDLLLWQSITPFVDNCYDLTNLSIQGNWSTRYAPRLMEMLTINKKVLGIPDRYNFWGIWYNKPMFQRLQLTPPTTWDEFLHTCKMITDFQPVAPLLPIIPIGITAGDKWQVMTWWQTIAVRLGGATWWRKFLGGEVDASIDPIHMESWKKNRRTD